MLSFPTLRMFQAIQESHSKHTAELAETVAEEAYERGSAHTREILLAGLKALHAETPDMAVVSLGDDFLAEIERLRQSAVDRYKAEHPEWLAEARGATRALGRIEPAYIFSRVPDSAPEEAPDVQT